MSPANGSPRLNAETAAKIKWLLLHSNLHQHQIAALFDLNQGRVSEVNTGKRFPNITPINPDPDDGQMAA